MIEAVTRFVFVATGMLGGYAVMRTVDWQTELGLDPTYVIILMIALGGASGFVLGGITGREITSAWKRVEARIAELSATDFVLSVAGLLVGLAVAFFAAQPLRLFEPAWLGIAASALLTLVSGYLGVSVALTRRREFMMIFPRFANLADAQPETGVTLLDTSVIIDGRFLELIASGFLPQHARVPRFVLAELQFLADSADDTRRARGRRGLDLLAAQPPERALDVMEVDYPDIAQVDEKLIRLAVDTGATIVTVDYNLAQVARVRGIPVLNLNEAAAALRPAFLPGDSIRLRVLKQGKEADQGVGYLEDGTMVVVQDGRALIGSDADLEVTSVLQTAAGRMIFARPVCSAAPVES